MRAHPSGSGGFSLIELLITLAAFALVLGGLMVLFDNSAALARAQTQVAVLQQSQRVAQSELVRFARAAGLGGLPVTTLNVLPAWLTGVQPTTYDNNPVFPENGFSLSVIDNVRGLKSIEDVRNNSATTCSTSTSDCVLPGSDVLIVRGVFTTPLYYFDPPLQVNDWVDDDAALGRILKGEITVRGKVRMAGKIIQGYPQDLAPLVEVLRQAKQSARGEAFILRDSVNPNAYVVMEFDHAAINLAGIEAKACEDVEVDPDDEDELPLCLTFPLRLIAMDPAPPVEQRPQTYADLAGGSILWNTAGPTVVNNVRIPINVGSIGLLEEYRFFVRVDRREQAAIFGPPFRLAPVLSRARFLPGNQQVDRVDIAENVIDLQLAVGVETDALGSGPGYGQILEGTALDPSPTATDEVLFNHPGDHDASSGTYAPPPGHSAWFDPDLGYHFLRINTLVESAEPERGHLAPPLTLIENYNRGLTFSVPGEPESTVNYNSDERRRYRRRWLRTVVELRNLL